MNDYWTSVIRTATPFLVGLLGSALVKLGFNVDDATLEAVVAFVLGSLWYMVARFVEQRKPSLGWLLGNPKQPVYTAPDDGGFS